MSGALAAFVLDSSVALGAFFEDEQDPYSLSVWHSLAEGRALVPALWHLEMGNILSRALRAGHISQAALDESWQRLDAVGLQELPLLGNARHWTQRATDWGLTTTSKRSSTAVRSRLPKECAHANATPSKPFTKRSIAGSTNALLFVL